MSRISREELYFSIAKEISKRSTCNRASVGAILVKDNHIFGTGYNGAPKGLKECYEWGCSMDNDHCVRTVHAELNALISAAYNGVSTKDAILYTTYQPCFRCELFLINAGIKEVVYLNKYDDGRNGKIANLKRRKYNDSRAK